MHAFPGAQAAPRLEFFGEVAIIVLGVLIALSAEQAIERWSWQEQIGAAREALRLEGVRP